MVPATGLTPGRESGNVAAREARVNLDSPYTRLALSTVLGAAIGWERTLDRKPAGLRTYAVVSLGSAVFMIAAGPGTTDASRVLQGIVTGIGFLGAGSILRANGTIRGLTSAATTWLAAGLGALTGLGKYALAIYLTVLTLVILRGLMWLEMRWRPADRAPKA